ncbi:GlxA family transcriptional regulator [Pseudoduganella violaceinigra]|uniref:GlxA family transcriptional regulator n=1 Tax=Pseudoduganella violaceinigra TaxID=246602 RepID=UPI000481E3F2|nr:helix-turn-helix domain-containing protein [Pseudoduganella violaceinigra]
MRKKVAIIAFDGITPFHLSVPCLVFGGTHAESLFEVTVCASERGPMRTTAGFEISTGKSLRALAGADIVIMPTWHDDCRPSPPALLQALRRAHDRGATIVGLCLGAFPVAEAGLLDGRTVTTHWAFSDKLAQRCPQVRVDEDVLYVDEGDVLTSAGAAASLDCSLYLLRKLLGADYANMVARRLLVAPHREGGQAQFIDRPVPATASDGRLAKVMEWVQHRLAEEHSLDALAERASMSRRNFTRHFRQATGTSFKQWLLNQRLTHAQRMLETSGASIEAVAQAAGFGSAISLRQHFRATFQSSPSAYRKLFDA